MCKSTPASSRRHRKPRRRQFPLLPPLPPLG
ncbi:unnamed protein product [Spirodela intermedia]|uniref:Uncharacterized protein n=1 Tax=Spirodela intermedia TaxID=51605 RepID=A0A7I8K8J9_SPIIN|nr:unnamed protein product [Spirodela intermedia]